MNSITTARLFITGGFLIAMIMTGCLRDNPATPSETEVKVTSTDPRIAFMVQGMGFSESAISRVVDPETNDTTYQVFPTVSEEAKAKGVLVGGFGFTTLTLDQMIQRETLNSIGAASETGKSNAADVAVQKSKALRKASHTRWDYWYSGMDVKALPEVHKVKVFITVVGSTRLGPNWQAAVRNAMSNWNAQAKGTAVSFVETTDPNNCDVKIGGSFGIGSDGTATHMAFLTADPYIEPNGVSLWVNTGHEHNGIPYNQKSTAAMSLLALATNITFTGMEGFYWNMGNLIHIPGTPVTDGDAETPGSSVLTYGTSPNSTPVLTAGDLRALQTVYPLHGVSAITDAVNGAWRTVGYESYPIATYGAASTQIAGDTVFFKSLGGSLWRKIGLAGSVEWIYNTSGYTNPPSQQFIYSKGNLAMHTNSNGGSIYTQMPGGGWVLQVTGVAKEEFRLDGNRLSYILENGGYRKIYSKYITVNGSSSTHMDWFPISWVSDFRIHNGLLVVVDNGHVYAKQGVSGGWYTLHGSNEGWAERAYVTDNLIAMYYFTPGDWTGSLAVRAGGLFGNWLYYSDPVYSADDIDVCGNNVAFLQESSYLRVMDYSTWAVHEHYQLSIPPIAKVQLTGANCDYVVTVDHSQVMRTKYGIDLNTDYYEHLTNVSALPQKW